MYEPQSARSSHAGADQRAAVATGRAAVTARADGARDSTCSTLQREAMSSTVPTGCDAAQWMATGVAETGLTASAAVPAW